MGPALRQLPWQVDPMGPENTVFKPLLDINWRRGRVWGKVWRDRIELGCLSLHSAALTIQSQPQASIAPLGTTARHRAGWGQGEGQQLSMVCEQISLGSRPLPPRQHSASSSQATCALTEPPCAVCPGVFAVLSPVLALGCRVQSRESWIFAYVQQKQTEI